MTALLPKPVRPPRAAPKRIRRSPIARKARAKVMPRCKHCAHPASKHVSGWRGSLEITICGRCEACPGYGPARGIRQKRRTPAAAVVQIADGLWRRIVKSKGVCEVQTFYPHDCLGVHQGMHGIPRTFKATRFLPINGFEGCAAIHKFFTDRPELWSAVLLDAWGEPTYRELWALARSSQKPDMDATVASLRAEIARLEA